VHIRPVEPHDSSAWLAVRQTLWPDSDTLEDSIAAYFAVNNCDAITLLAEAPQMAC
jgi:hypothetical protein